MELWIVGKYIGIALKIDGMVWEFGGVFSDKQKAIGACTNENMFVGPALLDEILPDESTNWEGCWYPLIEKEKTNG